MLENSGTLMKISIGMIAAAAIFLGFPSQSLAGRPVFQSLSLKELVDKSDVVAIVTKAKPFNISEDLSGCKKLIWQVKVKTVLKSGLQNIQGNVLRIHHNISQFKDCSFRQVNTSGASFPAIVYQSSNPETIANSSEFIVFLKARDRQFELVGDRTFESIDQRQELKQILQ
jgi:hypothetical protein